MASGDWILYTIAFIFMCSFIGAASTAIGNLMELYSDSFSSFTKSSTALNSASITSPLYTTSASTQKMAAMSFIAVKPLGNGDSQQKQQKDNAGAGSEQKELESNDDGDVSPLTSDKVDSATAIRRQYYNGKRESDEQASTLALTYFLELQSRLQHLHSLVSTATKEAHGGDVDIDQFVRHRGSIDNAADADDDQVPPPKDMLSELHDKNLKLIESVIQSVVHDKSHRVVLEQERDFYDRLSVQPKSSASSSSASSSGRKRRASLEQRVYESVEISLPLFAQTMTKLMRNPQSMAFMTSAAVLYSSGVLFYCVQHSTANASLIAYLFGVLCVSVVLGVGYLFSISSMTRHPQRFMTAAGISVATIVIAWRWIAHYFNVTAAFILIAAIVLAYQYKHAPINAKQRNLDELWLCLLLNCGLPLFAYYLQCPEMTQFPVDVDAVVADNAAAAVVMDTATSTAAAATATDIEMMTQQDPHQAQTWMLYAFDLVWKLAKMAMSDFWQMLDITYALEDTPAAAAAASTTTTVVNACAAVVNDVNVAASVDGDVVVAEMDMDGAAGVVAVDDSLYWFNKLFSAFPYALFNVILVSWFVTHSSMLVRNLSQYKTANSKFLYCVEIGVAHLLCLLFWYNGMLTSTLVLAMLVTLPWTLGLLKHVYEHKNIAGDAPQVMHHTSVYNLWFFIVVYVSLVYDWIATVGILYALFSPNLLMIALPLAMIIQCLPHIVSEFVWATNF